MDGILKRQYSQPAYIILLGLLIAAVPLSKYVMSMSQMGLLLLWFLDGNLKDKLKSFSTNKPALVVSSIFLLHVVGLIYTLDFNYAVKDLRIKVPLLILPLIFSTMPRLSKKQFDGLLLVFVLAVLSNTFISSWIAYFGDVTDSRSISLFISHIRFSLNVCLAAMVVLYLIQQKSLPWKWSVPALIAVFLWLGFFLLILGAMTGIVIFVVLLLFIGLYQIWSRQGLVSRLVFASLIVAVIASLAFYTSITIDELTKVKPVDLEKLDKTTSLGHKYKHDTVRFMVEDGRYVGLYISYPEMKKAWNERSELDYDGLDRQGQILRWTLIRYLASKDLRKDYEGVYALSEKDIYYIEQGVANHNYLTDNPLKNRLRQAIIGYNNYVYEGEAKGNSMMQRIELWKASLRIIGKHFLIGAGTGDVPDVFRMELKEMDSTLAGTGMRSHNQFISIFIAFGIIGFLWFLISLIFPLIYFPHARKFLYLSFMLIVLISFINEDTIESQAGLTFFAFFNAFLLFCAPLREDTGK